jgi:glycosyltransferase involved in cell wall biosynthesis
VENNGISVIIPAFNEATTIKACLESAQRLNPLEIIVVDGGSTDRTREIAQGAGAIVVQAQKGRGIQMNRGASLAKGEILLFLHADTIISNGISSLRHPELVGATLREDSHRDLGSGEMLKSETLNLIQGKVQHDIMEKSDKYIGGFFRLKFDNDSISTRLVELFANLRARMFSLPYGD